MTQNLQPPHPKSPVQIPPLPLLRAAQSKGRTAGAGYVKWSRQITHQTCPSLRTGLWARSPGWRNEPSSQGEPERPREEWLSALIFATFQWRLDQAFYSNTFSILISFPFSPFTRKGLLPLPTRMFNCHEFQTLQGGSCSSNHGLGKSKHISSTLVGPHTHEDSE